MSDLITRLKNMSNNINKCSDAEIKFLQKSDLSIVLDRAFNELYRLRPENPVLFLSKWLTRESRARELAKKYFDEEQKRSKLEQKFYQEEKRKKVENLKKEEKIKLRIKDENNLIQEIKNCKDFWLGFNHICQRLKELINSTGCYIGIYDLKRRPVMEDDDETGHIDPSNAKVLRYIGWNDDHNFLDGKYLEQNQGVTFDLIFPQQKSQQQEGENQTQNNQEQKPPETSQIQEKKEEINPEDNIQILLIEDVVNENRMNFFREPRLGCYLALDLTYKTSLSYNSLLSAIQCTKNYEEAKAAQEQRKKEWSDQQEEIKSQINQIREQMEIEEEQKRIAEEKALEEKAAKEAANAENSPENNQSQNNISDDKKEKEKEQSQIEKSVFPQPQNLSMNKKGGEQPSQEQENPIEALEKQLTEWTEEPVKLADYDKDETKIFLCLDTLGQDRVFSENEIKFIKKIGATIKDSMEKLEQSLLEKDRDIRIKFMELEKTIKSQEKYSDEKSEDLINLTLNQFYASEEYKSKGITEEDEKVFEGDLVKMKYLRDLYLFGEFKEAVETFQEFEFVEFSKVFQNLLYFCKTNPLDINEKNTNKLEWKKAKKYWSNIFNYATNYNPLGPKPEEVKSIYKLNKIKENLETSLQKRDEVKAYSQTLLMFIDFILFLIKVRHDDIIRRICNVAILKDKREQIIKTNAEIDEERQKIIDEAKALNPNVKVPGEGGTPLIPEKTRENQEGEKKEENKEEEKKEEKKEEEKKDEQQGEQQNPQNNNGEEAKDGEEQAQEKKDESDSIKLAEQLMKFDEEHVKQEVPPDVEYDIDNDYDIDQNEKDTIVNAALEAAKNPSPSPFDKAKANQFNNPKPANPQN